MGLNSFLIFLFNKLKYHEKFGWLRNRLRYCIWTDWKKPEHGGA